MNVAGFGVAGIAGVSLLLAGCASTPTTQLACPLQIAADFPITLLDGHGAILTIHISGQPFRMLVDSGSSDTFFTTAAFQRLTAVPNHAQITGTTTGLGGTAQVNFAFLDDVTLGSARVRNEVMLVSDHVLPPENGVPPADGILGADILRQFNVAYDFPDRHITLYYAQHCTLGETPWAGDYDRETISVDPETLMQTVPAAIDGQPLAMLLDTGAEVSLVGQDALDAHHIAPVAGSSGVKARMVGAGLRAFMVKREQFASLDIGAETFSPVWLPVTRGYMPPAADGMIGDDYLLHHRVFIETDSLIAYFGLSVPKS
jgi:hypothetical protein